MRLSANVKFLALWIASNTLTLGFSFWFATWWFIHVLNNLNPFISYVLPMKLGAEIIFGTVLGAVQLLFLQAFLQKAQLVQWIVATAIGLHLALSVRSELYLLYIFFNWDAPSTEESEYWIGAVSGAIGGVIGGVVSGLIQSFRVPLRKVWIVISAVGWAAGWSIGWIVMLFISSAIYNGALEMHKGFILPYEQRLAIYGVVLGLVSSAITGIGLLVCRK